MAQKGLQGGSSSAHLGVGYERKTDMDEDSSTSSLMIMEEGNRNYFSYNCYSPDLWGGIQFERGGLPCHAAATVAEEQQQGHKSRNSRHNNVGPLDLQLPSETTATSSSGGSISKGDQLKPFTESETQNEKRQEDSGENFKKSSGCSSKRSRAAEVHNLSEKRRRNRINEKMKALQNLIPNSNKTDKASMLDEAIDYLKKLQLQVQMLSARSGIDISSMRWLSQMPQLPIQQQQPVPSTCMGNRAQAAGPVSVPEIGLLNTNQSCERRSSLSAMEHQHHYETAVDISTSTDPDNEMQQWIQTSCKLGSQQSAFPLPQLPTTTQGVHSAIPLRDNKI